ncbi:phage tail protein [Neisseria sp. N95_16]|uniref:Phage tail protein n=1 Tax=Neisseria brasiliensis TaxID=2666100 RepID=A0A5Q3RUR6_9NEIS|nr:MULTISPECIES: tail protein X [Neisseria]MRN37193.1 phage tail protein [Neisseria brasiliensis]PJO10088.1 phage tail protein [Neisseria sp. N95_16]PJO78752.1 phage tail protein [Neisseria sp. N177_16]QGL24202.1 phage tail protein [Neisseria brasiliensis]
MAKINTITTKEGDTVASLTAAFYGSSRHVVQVLQANPDLSLYPVLLPAGLKVVMPAIDTQAVPTLKTINLWD